jgi:hypothetical protein
MALNHTHTLETAPNWIICSATGCRLGIQVPDITPYLMKILKVREYEVIETRFNLLGQVRLPFQCLRTLETTLRTLKKTNVEKMNPKGYSPLRHARLPLARLRALNNGVGESMANFTHTAHPSAFTFVLEEHADYPGLALTTNMEIARSSRVIKALLPECLVTTLGNENTTQLCWSSRQAASSVLWLDILQPKDI